MKNHKPEVHYAILHHIELVLTAFTFPLTSHGPIIRSASSSLESPILRLLANSHRLTPVLPSSLPPTKTSRGVKLCIATQVDLLKITRCERTTFWLASINLSKLKPLPRDVKSICSSAQVISSFPAAQRFALGCCQTMVSHQFRAEPITSYHHIESADLSNVVQVYGSVTSLCNGCIWSYWLQGPTDLIKKTESHHGPQHQERTAKIAIRLDLCRQATRRHVPMYSHVPGQLACMSHLLNCWSSHGRMLPLEATALVALTGMQALEVAVEWLRLVTKITRGTGKRDLTREKGNPR